MDIVKIIRSKARTSYTKLLCMTITIVYEIEIIQYHYRAVGSGAAGAAWAAPLFVPIFFFRVAIEL